jgi:hypothetical protein
MATRLLALTAVALACGVANVRPGFSQRDAVRVRSASCSEIILNTKFPYATGHYRVVLDALSVPPAYLPQVVATQDRLWPYWEKAGMVVRAGAGPVTVTVPSRWRSRAAIGWGNGGPPGTSVTFAGCPGPPNVGHAYAGGFYLRARSGCVPLRIKVARRTTTVWVGLRRHCG